MMDKFFSGIPWKQSERQSEDAIEFDPPISEDVMMPISEQGETRVVSVNIQRTSRESSPVPQQKKTKIIWDKISRACIYLLFGLMPIFFLPFSAFPVDEAKNILIALGVLLAAAAWLAKVLAVGRIEIPKTKLWLFALVFLAGAGISTVFSLSSSVSVWGNNFQPDAFFALLLAFLALFVTSVVFTEAEHIKRAQILLAWSSILVAVLSLLQFFGKYILFFDFTKTQSFNVFGSLQNVSVFLGLGLVAIIAMLSTFRLGRMKQIVFIVGSLLITGTLLFLNASYIWLGLMLGFALAATWQTVRSFVVQQGGKEAGTQQHALPAGRKARSHASLFMVLMIASAIFFFVGFPANRIVSLPPSVSPSFLTTLGIGKDMLHDGVGRAMFGSGPGTFLYEYSAHRPDAINSTSFFAVRFLQGFSFISTIFVSLGIFGIVSFLGFLGYFVLIAFRGVSRLNKNLANLGENLVSFVGFIFLLFSWFLYPMSTPLVVLTFLFGGLLIASLRNEGVMHEIRISFAQSVQTVFLFSFGAIILLAGIMISAYWQAQHYAAAVVAAKGVEEYNATNGSATDDATSKLSLAISLDGSNDLYFRTLAQLFTVRAQNVLHKGSESQDVSVLQQNFQKEFQNAIQAAQLATTINAHDPLNWQALGDVYASFFNVVSGSDTFAIQNYQQMIVRDPKNPSIYLIVAQAYVNASDAIQTKITNAAGSQTAPSQTQQLQNQSSDYLSKAQDTLKQAVALKPDYASALYLVAEVYDRQGDRAQAIASAQQARTLNPQDVGINYELGVLYYLDNQFDAARVPFEQAVVLNPNYSNARYFLGLVYAKENQTQKAIDQFQAIQKLNPDNAQVKQIIANLQEGRNALDGLSNSQQQIQEPVPQAGSEPPTPLKKKK